MKKITHLIILVMIAAGATAFIAHKSTTPTPVPPANIVWFNTIEIAEGITVEFEYGSKLEVYVEGDKELVNQIAIVLENQVLKATGKTQLVPVEGIKIKVVTPVLINLAQAQSLKASVIG